MLSFVMLGFVMLDVVILSVVATFSQPTFSPVIKLIWVESGDWISRVTAFLK
jgi:hypothetical protein